jgi:type III restriction enzyme
MFPVEDIIEQLHNKFQSIDLETEDSDSSTNYADKYSEEFLYKLIRESLKRIEVKDDVVSDQNRQKILQAFGVIQRPGAKVVRHRMTPQTIEIIKTRDRKKNSIGLSSIRRGETTVFWDDNTKKYSDEEALAILREIEKDESLPRSSMQMIDNSFNFKTSLNVVLADHKPERLFVRELIKSENSKVLDAWVKSTDQDFYPIEYAWKKGEHPKRGRFNPDFFIKIDKIILVVEIKSDEEIAQPSDENKAKYKAGKNHFKTLNKFQPDSVYYFNFLSPQDYELYFDLIRKKEFHFTSNLDAVLEQNGA